MSLRRYDRYIERGIKVVYLHQSMANRLEGESLQIIYLIKEFPLSLTPDKYITTLTTSQCHSYTEGWCHLSAEVLLVYHNSTRSSSTVSDNLMTD